MILHIQHIAGQSVSFVGVALSFFFFVTIYACAILFCYKKKRSWPLYRFVFWTIASLIIALSISGPLAERAHHGFVAHMCQHLLLGMLAPIVIVFAAPLILLLRVLPVKLARILTRLLKSFPLRYMSHPITAMLLNIGGLSLLYTTELYSAMHTSQVISAFVHIHIFLAGYLFTTAIIKADFSPHKAAFRTRVTVLIATMAGHNILSKWIYVNPPASVLKSDAENGGLLMYYGGGLTEVILIILLCYEYYQSVTPAINDANSENTCSSLLPHKVN